MYKKFNINLFVLLLVTLIFLGFENKVTAQSSSLYAGVAKVDITPPVGYGQYRGPSTGVKDPLYAKAIVFKEGAEVAALVVCDVIGITRELSSEVRLGASEKTGIPYENIIVAATHTHTGPVFHTDDGSVRNNPDVGFPLEEYVNKKRAGKLTDEDKNSYEAHLIRSVEKALVNAYNEIEKVTIKSGTDSVEGISFNRRFIMKDGRVRTNPGVGNPDVVRPVGPIDPEVGILLLRNVEDDLPVAGLINFANHMDTIGGTEYSADYPAYLARTLKESLGMDFMSIFAQGASGDINHVDVLDSTHQKGTRTVTQRIGESLAEVVEKQIPNLVKSDQTSLNAESKFIYAPVQQYTTEELEWAMKEKRDPLYNQRSFIEFRRMLKIRSLAKMRRTAEVIPPTIGTEQWTIPLEIQVIKINDDIAIVGLPGELFVELGLAIKKSSPFETTLVIELTNRHIAYVPTEGAFLQGGYETVNSRLAPGGGEMMVEAAIEILKGYNK